MFWLVNNSGNDSPLQGTMVIHRMEVKQDTVHWLLFRVFLVSTLLLLFGSPLLAKAQGSVSLPVAITLAVNGTTGTAGELVVYDSATGEYSISTVADEKGIAGVVAENPPLVFSTDTNNVPVVTSGAVYVRVDYSAGQVLRGDLLTSSVQAGIAAKATMESEEVFAIALEDVSGAGVPLVLAQLDPEAAKTVLRDRQKEAEENALLGGLLGSGGGSDDDDERGFLLRIVEDYARAVVASLIAAGSLLFLMYTFRSVILNATTSVGRNPRARNAIMMVSIGNLVFTVIVCLVALFVAIGILVLPV